MILTRLLICLLALFVALPASAADDTSARSVTYVPADDKSVSDVMFKKGVLKTDDPVAVEEYLRIHYCGLYEKYGQNDFAWSRIRESTARVIEIHRGDLPEGLEVQNLIQLDQYDMASNQLPLMPASYMNEVQLISAINNKNGTINACKALKIEGFVPRVHPVRFTVKLNRPLTLTTFPIGRGLASQYLDYVTKSGATERSALVVMRIRVSGPDPLFVTSEPLERQVLGQLVSLAIYEGPNRRMLLYSKNYENPEDEAGKN